MIGTNYAQGVKSLDSPLGQLWPVLGHLLWNGVTTVMAQAN